jgi:nicotinamide mononucleotide transporter
MSKLELVAVIFSVLGVWLTAKQNRLCWPINLIATGLYLLVFYQVKLYSDALLQGIFILLLVYGWYSWSTQRLLSRYSVSHIQRQGLYAGLAGAVLLGASLGFLSHRYTDAALPWMDAFLTSFSIVNSLWAAKKYIESWWMWCLIDGVYVLMFGYKGLYLTALLYFMFIGLALNGWWMWSRLVQPSSPSLSRS